MANDIQDTIRQLFARVAEQDSKGVRNAKRSGGGLWGIGGFAAGAAVSALVPLAAKGLGKAVKSNGSDGLEQFVGGLGDKTGGGPGDGPGGGSGDRPGGGPGDGHGGGSGDGPGGAGKSTVPGVGKGRRMPVQQSVDIGVPIETVYNQWTQFELWPNFMHRVIDVTKKDDCSVSFSTKIWGKKREFVARIETQRPNERIKWKVEQGLTHTGVVTFHELGPRLTRVLVNLDVEPGGMLEKAARGLRHVKRAVRADLHRFKAFIETREVETGAWRGVIEKGKVVQKHDDSYDKDREYSSSSRSKSTPSRSGSSSSGGSRGRGSSNGSSASSGSSRGRGRGSNHSEGRSRSRRS